MKHLFPLIFLLTTISLSAQLREFHITEREPDGTSVVQASTDFPDNAMILVYSALEGLDFRSSVGGINQQRYNARANRYEILLSPQRQILFVAARGFIEQRIALINPTPKQVYYYLVEERSGQDEISVFFNVEPKDAKLFVDNVPTDINKTVSVPLGTVNIRLEREGYRPVDEALVISAEQVNYEYKMREVEPVIVKLTSNLAGAKVIVDATERGEMNDNKSLSLFLFPGNYTVEVQKSGYLSQTQTLVVEEGKVNELKFALEKNTGSIRFDVRPSNAVIKINKSPLEEKTLVEYPPGRYRVDIELENYESYSETFDLARGQRHTVQASLKPYTGSLQFSVVPDNAQVILRNAQGAEIKRWEGLQLIKDLQVGQYEVEASASGHKTDRKTFFVIKSERRVLNLEMEQSSKLDNVSIIESTVIGNQVWMSRNLDVDRFRNGDPIPEAKTYEEWKKAGQNGQPAWCYHNNNPDNGDRYGKLYNWFAVNDPRGLAPEGWKIPSDEDWTRLTDFLGGESVAGKKMKSTEFWADSGNGTNESGFSGLPGGARSKSGTFYSIGKFGFWWSSTESFTDLAWFRYLYYNDGYVTSYYNYKSNGFSVRCLRD